MATLTLAALAPEYFRLFLTCQPDPKREAQIADLCSRILLHRERYERVASKLPAPPWWVIALLHAMEADLSFSTHLHNGDPLRARTVQEPAGRPTTGQPPFTWEESAWDAVRFDRLDKLRDFSVAGACWAFEKFNGFGYRSRGVRSPYLWAGSNHEQPGKFVADGQFDATARSQQIGAAVLLHRLCTHGDLALPGQPVITPATAAAA